MTVWGRTTAALVVLGLFAAACTSTEAAGEPQASNDPHGVAIQFVLDRGHAEDRDLVFVVEPAPEMWDQWCSLEGDFVPCRALQAMTIDLAAPFPPDVAAEIEAVLVPRDVEFIDDRSTVILPLAVTPPEVEDDAGLLSFGRAIEVDGKIYLPLDAIGEGWLFELTPTEQGWEIDVLAQWIG
jgi:hypothetical protein